MRVLSADQAGSLAPVFFASGRWSGTRSFTSVRQGEKLYLMCDEGNRFNSVGEGEGNGWPEGADSPRGLGGQG
jgi:hypothetical protein